LFNEDTGERDDSFYDERYLWVRPSEDNLYFIKEQTVKAGCCQLVSIGCGSGLLEWLIHTATGRKNSFFELQIFQLRIVYKSQKYGGCCLWYFVLWFSSCWSGVELRVIPRNTTGSNHRIILLSS